MDYTAEGSRASDLAELFGLQLLGQGSQLLALIQEKGRDTITHLLSL